MNHFLKLVADTYSKYESDSLHDYCFVFPNKRSGTFFTNYLELSMGQLFIMPAVISMSDFVEGFSDRLVASRYEQIFTLYNCYRHHSQDIVDFDKFLFWGEMLVNDFNDVDSYLADTRNLFSNVKRLKEIKSNYLTPQQLEIIKEYWGEEPHGYNSETFWNHINDDGELKTGGQFLKLWEILYPLYCDFIEALGQKSLTTRGQMYRNAVEKLSQNSADFLPYKRYIFVGFNVLTIAEIAIFKRLKDLGVADFYWDYNSPAFKIKENHASRYMARNIKRFPSRYDFDGEEITGFPEIEIVGVASKVGQVKYAGTKLAEWFSQDGIISDKDNAIDTAVVLPDEHLFIPMIHSLPKDVKNVNITMGYPMRHTPIASLMHNIVSLHLRSRFVRGQLCYFYDDIMHVLSSPLVRSIAPTEATRAIYHLNQNRLFTIQASELIELTPSLEPVFTVVEDDKNFEQVYSYTTNLVKFLRNKLPDSGRSVETMFLDAYSNALSELGTSIKEHDITMTDNTFFHLLERAVSTETVSFVGQPLKGLQIMGVLETRALNFDNLIILSMNERIFPRKHFSRSFIPESLRGAYGLSTSEFQESMYAYTFYRLISRSKRVTLIYDARTIGGKSSEMSRYLTQLLYLHNTGKIKHIIANYPQISFNRPTISINKTDEILNKLKLFTVKDSGMNLSASSINEYINCGLSFYLKYVEGYREADVPIDYMDSSTYGTVVHEVAENLYKSLLGPDEPMPAEGIEVTEKEIDRLLNSKVIIDRLITRSINKNYLKYKDAKLETKLDGENLLIGRAIKLFITAMLNEERRFCPFRFIAAEHEIKTQMTVNENLKVNIRQFIDRVDIINTDNPDGGRLRMVDYKTGSDKLDARSLESLFTAPVPPSEYRPKAFLQLMFYCYAYSNFNKPTKPIQPYIYALRTIKTKGLPPLTIDKQEVTDYSIYHDDFVRIFNEKVAEIFDPKVPFNQAIDSHACTFCQFKGICNKE